MDRKTPAGSSMDDSGDQNLRLKPMHVPPQCVAILRRLTAAANSGAACPSNAVLASAAGIASTGAASDQVALLEAMGVITVARGQNHRVVTIVSTGRSTAGHVRVAHVGGARRAQVAA